MWTDESKIELWGPSRTQFVRRPKGQALNSKFTIKTIKHPISIMVWGAISSKGVGTIHKIDGKMDAQKYVDILKKNLNASKQKLGMGGRGKKFIFQQGRISFWLYYHFLIYLSMNSKPSKERWHMVIYPLLICVRNLLG